VKVLSLKHVYRLKLYGFHINSNETSQEIMCNLENPFQIKISDMDDKFLSVCKK
jgi:hypothetical protein